MKGLAVVPWDVLSPRELSKPAASLFFLFLLYSLFHLKENDV